MPTRRHTLPANSLLLFDRQDLSGLNASHPAGIVTALQVRSMGWQPGFRPNEPASEKAGLNASKTSERGIRTGSDLSR